MHTISKLSAWKCAVIQTTGDIQAISKDTVARMFSIQLNSCRVLVFPPPMLLGQELVKPKMPPSSQEQPDRKQAWWAIVNG